MDFPVLFDFSSTKWGIKLDASIILYLWKDEKLSKEEHYQRDHILSNAALKSIKK